MPPTQPSNEQRSIDRRDMMAAAGFLSLAYGLWLVTPAAAFIVCGSLVLSLCIWSARETPR